MELIPSDQVFHYDAMSFLVLVRLSIHLDSQIDFHLLLTTTPLAMV
ncbi:hypothetical protein [Streptococcus suis]|nr:hypothetical protein [Streptococcus suis]